MGKNALWSWLVLFFVISGHVSAAQTTGVKLTVVKHYKVGRSEDGLADTLMSSFLVDTSKTKIDAYFCSTQFQMPHVLPSTDMFTSVEKQGECNMSNGSDKTKCYKFDKNGRVTEMYVGGRGYNSVWTYKFNKKAQLVSILHDDDIYSIDYDSNGNIILLSLLNFKVEKRLDFLYQQ